jgi:hypothetical protein
MIIKHKKSMPYWYFPIIHFYWKTTKLFKWFLNLDCYGIVQQTTYSLFFPLTTFWIEGKK